MDNITLIGMPSCGKSTLGRLLSKELGYAFLDTDDVIIRRNGCPLRDILDREGVEGFKVYSRQLGHSSHKGNNKDGKGA